jgi:hypothetical protein
VSEAELAVEQFRQSLKGIGVTKPHSFGEEQWLKLLGPADQLAELVLHHKLRGSVAGKRKLRLFCTEGCRLVWDRLDTDAQRMVEAAERYVAGVARKADLAAVHANAESLARAASEAARPFDNDGVRDTPAGIAAFQLREMRELVQYTTAPAALDRYQVTHVVTNLTRLLSTVKALNPWSAYGPALEAAGDRVKLLIRCLFGNPFRPVAFDATWKTSAVVGLAETIFADRAFGCMPILADALQDAGCNDDSILDHCRRDGPHVRGCWVVDMFLGKP